MEFERLFEYQPGPTEIGHHKQACCARAQYWLAGIDRSSVGFADSLAAPTWLRQRYEWGPGEWPMYWCDVPCREVLDCGAFAAVSTFLFGERGFSAFSVQVVQRFSEENVRTWTDLWERNGCSPEWLVGRWAYHECTGIVIEGILRVWDPTENHWLDPGLAPTSYGGLVGIRAEMPGQAAVLFGSQSVRPRTWEILS